MAKRNVVQEAIEDVEEMKKVAIANAKSVLSESFNESLKAALNKSINESLATGDDVPAGYDEDGEQKRKGDNLPADGEAGEDLSDEGDGPAVIEMEDDYEDDLEDEEEEEEIYEMEDEEEIEIGEEDDEVDIDIDIDTDDEEEEIEETETVSDEEEVVEETEVVKENKKLKMENSKLRKAITLLKETVSETNLFNTRLAYATKTFNKGSFTRKQKETICKRFDECESISEVKKTYKALNEGMSFARNTNKRIKGNKVVHPVSSSQLTESAENTEFARWQRLADLA